MHGMAKCKFFLCKHCGNLVEKIHDSGVPIICCGEPMEELKANTVEASVEKHIPVIKSDGDAVEVFVGSAAHPMQKEHYIQWVYIETVQGGQRKALEPGDEPKACFALCGDTLVAAYAYCNLHGLWKADA